MEDLVPSTLRQRIPIWAGPILLVIAITYLAWALNRQWHSVATVLATYPLLHMAGAAILATFMMTVAACYQVLILRPLVKVRTSVVQLGAAYALGQIVRYLPGKILGLIYQAHRLGGASAAPAVFVVNIVQFTHTVFVIFGMVAATTVGNFYGMTGALIIVASTFAGLFFSHRYSFAERFLYAVSRQLPILRTKLDSAVLVPRGRSFAVLASLLLLLQWLPFVAGWMLLLPRNSDAFDEALITACCYSVASLAASLAIVVPSGIILREAVFVWLGTRLAMDPSHLLVLGLIARLVYTSAEVLLASILLGLDTLNGRER